MAPGCPPSPPCIDETTLPDPLGRPNANMQHYTPISGTRSAPRAPGRRFSARIRGPIFSRTTAAHALCRSGTRQRLMAQPSRVTPHGSDVQSRWRWPVGDGVRPPAFPHPALRVQRFWRHRCLAPPLHPRCLSCIDWATPPDPPVRPSAQPQHPAPAPGTRSLRRVLKRWFSGRAPEVYTPD